MASSFTKNPSSYKQVLFNWNRWGLYPYQKTKQYWVSTIALLTVYLIAYFRFVIAYMDEYRWKTGTPFVFFLGYFIIVFGIPYALGRLVDYAFYRSAKRKK